MAKLFNVQVLVKHIADGTIGQKLCRICLLPLDDLYEDIFTMICKSDKEYCVADIMREICNVKIEQNEESKICPSCFIAASNVYKFYTQTLQSQEILNFYIDELNNQLSIEIPDDAENLCISLPDFKIDQFDYDFSKHKYKRIDSELSNPDLNNSETIFKHDNQKDIFDAKIKQEYKIEPNESMIIIMNDTELSKAKNIGIPMKREKKATRCRNPMEYKMCSRCPIQYRFVGKLKEHMKTEHNIDLFVCQVCKALIEDEREFNTHLQNHTGIHTCEICNMVFKKRKTIIEHLKWHEKVRNINIEGVFVCEMCGIILASEADLAEHTDKKHVNKYTCYYCGRMYKLQLSFEMHIKKHEMHMNGEIKTEIKQSKEKSHTCSKCGRVFVDERALMWHERLHAGEKPHVCRACGRRFVSATRRNQHQRCAHTAPTRRCPLCPALFHLTSMVNTHIKRVHLRTDKRRNRHRKMKEVYWKTETVPIQELSVAVQNEILKLKTAQDNKDFI